MDLLERFVVAFFGDRERLADLLDLGDGIARLTKGEPTGCQPTGKSCIDTRRRGIIATVEPPATLLKAIAEPLEKSQKQHRPRVRALLDCV